jgi:NADPH2:quinone reductase
MTNMRAIEVGSLDGPRAVRLVNRPAPTPAPGQVLVEVHAAGVNFPDVLMTRGHYQMKPELPFIPGSEVAGVRLDTGERVAGFAVLGGYAELVIVDEPLLFSLPDRVSFPAGAALLMNYLTVDFALHRRGQLLPGQTVVVHGAAGGIGVATLQLAKLHGARTIAVVSTPAQGELAREAGADDVVLADGFREAVRALGGADLVVDPVGGERFVDSLRCLNTEGKLLVIGFTDGAIPEVKVNRLLLNNISVVGVGWGAFWMSRQSYLTEQWQRLLPHLESGALQPLIGSEHPLEHAADALASLEERRARAKVVITVR